MKKLSLFLFGVFSYGLFLFCTLFLMGFLNNKWVPAGIDQGINQGSGFSTIPAVLINVALITLFGFSHSLMAREPVKQWLAGWLPAASIRSLYVFQSSAILIAIGLLWQPLSHSVWQFQSPILFWGMLALQGIGWFVVVLATFAINHFELTGLQQVYCNLRNRPEPAPRFVTPWLYKLVRHPMQLGLLMAFWCSPQMSAGHCLFAATMTVYILIGIYFEERSLVKQFGDAYRQYQKQVPKLLPFPVKRSSPAYAQ